jgi:hypothetical protein
MTTCACFLSLHEFAKPGAQSCFMWSVYRSDFLSGYWFILPGLIMFAGVLDVPTNGVKINGFPNSKCPRYYCSKRPITVSNVIIQIFLPRRIQLMLLEWKRSLECYFTCVFCTLLVLNFAIHSKDAFLLSTFWPKQLRSVQNSHHRESGSYYVGSLTCSCIPRCQSLPLTPQRPQQFLLHWLPSCAWGNLWSQRFQIPQHRGLSPWLDREDSNYRTYLILFVIYLHLNLTRTHSLWWNQHPSGCFFSLGSTAIALLFWLL